MGLVVTDPVQAINAPAAAHQLQQGFWCSAQVRQKQLSGMKQTSDTVASGRDFHDPAGVDPGLSDVLWSLFDAQHPDDLGAVARKVTDRSARG